MPPMPTTKLASIKLGLSTSAKVAVYHKATEDSDKVLLYPAFPKDLGIAFSGLFAKTFNALPLSQIPLSELKPKSSTSIVIQGGKIEVHRAVLDWIMSCGEAGKTVAFRWFNSPAFFDYCLVVLACENLQVNVLEAQVLARIRDIAAQQVHSIDVERTFSAFSGPNKFKDMVCESIGQALWDRKLKAMGAYKRLFNMPEYAEFKEGTDAAYGKLENKFFKTPEGKVAKKEREIRAQKAAEKREAAKLRQEENFKRFAARRHNVEPSRITPTGNGAYTLTTDARQVRSGHGGRPGYVQLDLGQLGVTSRQFRGAGYPASPARRNQFMSTANAADKATATEPMSDMKATSNARDLGSKGETKATSVGDLTKGVKDMEIGKE